jgi:epsilon-lactone hydrolase
MPSLRARLVRRGFVAALQAQRRLLGDDITPEASEEEAEEYALKLREQFEDLAARWSPAWIDVEPADGAPVPTDWVTTERSDPDRVVLHLHGGAYILGSPRTHRGLAAALARTARARVLLPDYRLAPEHPFPAALDDAVATYRWLVHERGVGPERVAVCGDSAGGGLALALLVRLRDEGTPLPACYVGLSPWTDLAGTGASMRDNAARDPWLRAELTPLAAVAYAGERSLEDPLVSPLYADLTGLPPMLVHAGDHEILLDDARRTVERAREAGVTADLGVFHGLWHVFQAFPGIPESRWSLREIGAFIRRHTGAAWSRAA